MFHGLALCTEKEIKICVIVLNFFTIRVYNTENFVRNGHIKMGSFRYKLQQFFYGRNGPDTLYNVCVWVSFAFAVAGVFTPGIVGYIFFGIYFLLFGYSIFRLLSKNVYRRQRENAAFTGFFDKIKKKFRFWKTRIKDKDHTYRKCPHCKSQLRLPKKKGKHSVRCPRCRNEFDVRI